MLDSGKFLSDSEYYKELIKCFQDHDEEIFEQDILSFLGIQVDGTPSFDLIDDQFIRNYENDILRYFDSTFDSYLDDNYIYSLNLMLAEFGYTIKPIGGWSVFGYALIPLSNLQKGYDAIDEYNKNKALEYLK